MVKYNKVNIGFDKINSNEKIIYNIKIRIKMNDNGNKS